MAVNKQKLEREFFRMLNRVVEPAVRKGVGSPPYTAGGHSPGWLGFTMIIHFRNNKIMNDYLHFQSQLAFHAVIVLMCSRP